MDDANWNIHRNHGKRVLRDFGGVAVCEIYDWKGETIKCACGG